MTAHILLSLLLLVASITLISIGDSEKRTVPLFFVGGITMCIFLAHLVMLILMKVANLI